MDYDTLEGVGFCVLSTAGPVGVLIAGALLARGRSAGPLAQLWLVGLVASLLSIIAAWFAPSVFPPPPNPELDSGRGLDLRGLGFFIGGLVGCVGTIGMTALVSGAVFVVRRYRGGHRSDVPTRDVDRSSTAPR